MAITTNRHFRYGHSGAQLNVLSGGLRRQENLDILGEIMGLYPQKDRSLLTVHLGLIVFIVCGCMGGANICRLACTPPSSPPLISDIWRRCPEG